MKKVLIICLVVFTCLISGCSKNYESIYEEIKNLELKEVFTSEEEKLAFFERAQENYNCKEYFNSESNIIRRYFISESAYVMLETTLSTKYQQVNNKLMGKFKQISNYTDEYGYVSYFEKDIEYRKTSHGLKTWSSMKNSFLDSGQYIQLFTYLSLDDEFFLNLSTTGRIEKIGRDKKGNIVVVKLVADEGIEKYVFKDERIVEYECVDFEFGELKIYCLEKYNYKKNSIKYPDFGDYVYSGS